MDTVKSFIVALVLALSVPTLVDAQEPAPDSRQAPLPAADRRDDRDDRNWGWIGLLGLAGLAGLIRRDRPHDSNRIATGTNR